MPISAGLVFGLRLVGTGLRLGIQLALARWLGPAQFGRFVVARGWGELLAKFPNGGLELTSVRILPRFVAENRTADAAAFVRRGERLTMVRAILLATLSIVVAATFGTLDLPLGLGLSLAATVSVGLLYVSFLHGLGRLVPSTAIVEAVQPATFAISIGLLAILDRLSAASALVALLVATLVALVSQRTLLANRLWSVQPDGGATNTVFTNAELTNSGAETLPETRPLYISQLSIAAINQSGLLVVGLIEGPVAAGLFAVALRISSVGRLGTSAVEATNAPALAATAVLEPDDARMQQQDIVDRAIRLVALPSLGFLVVVSLISGSLLDLFGSEYGPARNALLILLVANTLESFTGPSGYLLSAAGPVRSYATIMAVHAVALVVLAIVMSAWFGLIGVAIAQGMIIVSWNVALVVEVRRTLGVLCLPRIAIR